MFSSSTNNNEGGNSSREQRQQRQDPNIFFPRCDITKLIDNKHNQHGSGGGKSRSSSVCPSLDDPDRITSVSNNDYDTDYFGGCHDFDDIDEEFDDPLSWRLDPSRSLSDWTIQISHQSSGSVTTYSVHKNILAVGPKMSAYFSSLFRCTQNVSESATSTSCITLEDSAADAFPILLDFMYSPSHDLDVTTKNAVALRYLAQYFGIRMLHRKVMDFLRRDINLGNVDSYIADSFLFHDEKISSFVADTCSTNILELGPDSGLVKTVNPGFFLHVISSPEIDTCAVSGHLSKLVASYCTIHKDELDESTFRELTHRNHMPLIDRDAALDLLGIESELCKRQASLSLPPLSLSTSQSPLSSSSLSVTLTGETKSTDGLLLGGGGEEGEGYEHHHNHRHHQLTCLQKRCIRVLALNWKELTSDNRKVEAYATLKNLNSEVLMELFDKSLSVAEQRIEETAKSAEMERVHLEQKYDLQLNEIREKYQQQQQILERVRQVTTETIDQLRRQVAERDQQLEEYRREMKCFHRVPTNYSFSDIKKNTYHHLSQPEPFDSVTYPCQFGRRRPTSMPRVLGVDRTEDGYLFVSQEKGNVLARWPMYYYRETTTTTTSSHDETPMTIHRKNYNNNNNNNNNNILRRVQQNSCQTLS